MRHGWGFDTAFGPEASNARGEALCLRQHEFWDLDVPRWSRAAAARIMMALVELDGRLTGSLTFRYGPLRKIMSAFFRISLPDGQEEAFEKLSGYTLISPPRICVPKDCGR